MRRVVVTGMGLVSCLGNTLESVSASLRDAISGICHVPEYAELGMRNLPVTRKDVVAAN